MASNAIWCVILEEWISGTPMYKSCYGPYTKEKAEKVAAELNLLDDYHAFVETMSRTEKDTTTIINGFYLTDEEIENLNAISVKAHRFGKEFEHPNVDKPDCPVCLVQKGIRAIMQADSRLHRGGV